MKNIRTKLVFTAIAVVMLLFAVFAISTTAAQSYTTITFIHGDEVYARTFQVGGSYTLPSELDSKVGGTVYGWFDKEGNFRILQIADTQDDMFASPGMLHMIKTALEKYQPDLVVFTGDNTSTVSTQIDAKY